MNYNSGKENNVRRDDFFQSLKCSLRPPPPRPCLCPPLLLPPTLHSLYLQGKLLLTGVSKISVLPAESLYCHNQYCRLNRNSKPEERKRTDLSI